MSGTRSRFPKAQVTDALIVAHGQPSDPGPAEAETAALAALVAQRVPGIRVRGVTLAMPGSLPGALQTCARPPVIYPMFMTDGWFTATALPRRLDGMPGTILAPFGRDVDLPRLAARSLTTFAAKRGWPVDRLTLILAAHGSGRSRNAAEATRDFAQCLRALIPLAALRVGFVEECPSIKDAASGVSGPAICLPFFAAAGGHVLTDIPQDLARAGFRGTTLSPIGKDPAVPSLIARAINREYATATA